MSDDRWSDGYSDGYEDGHNDGRLEGIAEAIEWISDYRKNQNKWSDWLEQARIHFFGKDD